MRQVTGLLLSNFCKKIVKKLIWKFNEIFPNQVLNFLNILTDVSMFSRRAVVSYWRKYVHEVLVNRLGGLSLPWKSVVRLTDHPDMTLDVYRGRKTTVQHTTDMSMEK